MFFDDFNSTPKSGVFEMMALQNIDRIYENWLGGKILVVVVLLEVALLT